MSETPQQDTTARVGNAVARITRRLPQAERAAVNYWCGALFELIRHFRLDPDGRVLSMRHRCGYAVNWELSDRPDLGMDELAAELAEHLLECDDVLGLVVSRPDA